MFKIVVYMEVAYINFDVNSSGCPANICTLDSRVMVLQFIPYSFFNIMCYGSDTAVVRWEL